MNMIETMKEHGLALVFDDIESMRNGPEYIADEFNKRLIHDTGSLVSRLSSLPYSQIYSFENRPEKYMYVVGCYHNPGQWAGHRYNRTCPISIFENMDESLRNDIRNNRCLLVFDQVQEGNHASWLWDWFRDNAERFNLPICNMLYLTADLSANDSYQRWRNESLSTDELNIVPDMAVQCYDFAYTNRHNNLPTWRDHINYKLENLNKIKLFNCLNRRVALHRQWLYVRLYQENLLEDSLVSMDHFYASIGDLGTNACLDQNTIDQACSLLPLTIDDADFTINKFLNLNTEIYLNSWFSIVTETHADNDQQVIISEKTLKPILAAHPFMVYGSRRVLHYLKELGFKTWPGIWDESYDYKYDFYRLDTIINNIKTVKQERDLMEWFKRFEDSVSHNQSIALKLYWENQKPKHKIVEVWNKFISK